ncbi:hypothetical protein [Mycobacterium vicinigordonae]|uniref:Uncharacterized protein n=1 Tax=Mycobacterium vicinigordonae TaxID=1719132 RepID=A0A7D6IPW3_9MYCO|nr:hypothetical protein [Mycobacterium vicinigordonae]QLL05999.1 hypothetical protein H0P51_19740 [Mycobacterium vicinigordonae]
MSGPVSINVQAVSSAMGNVQTCLDNTRHHIEQMTQVLETVKRLHVSDNATSIMTDANNLESDLREIVDQMTQTRNEVYEKGNALLQQAGHAPMPMPA